LARDLFLRLCSVNAQLRYSASIALTHPWITRKFETPIPLTIYERNLQNQLRHEVNDVLRTVFFVGHSVERVLYSKNVDEKGKRKETVPKREFIRD